MRKLPLLVGLLVAAVLLPAAIAHSAGRRAPANGYWTAAACGQKVRKFLLPTTDGHRHNFSAAQAVCVGRGGQQTCEWTGGDASRLYSEFTVYTRSDHGGVVRSFTLDTHSGHGVPAWASRSSDPPPFYVSSVMLIALNTTPARFSAIVGPIAARLRQQQNARGCKLSGG